MTNQIMDPGAQTLKNHNIIEHAAENYTTHIAGNDPIKSLIKSAHRCGALALLLEIESGRIVPRKPKEENKHDVETGDVG